MSLNPVQFGAEVIDQFGRYLMTTFPIADQDMEAQVREHLRHDIGGERLIAKGPYVYLNRPFEEGPSIKQLCAEQGLGLHPALRGILSFDVLHKHQELALRSIKAGRHTIVATGTGSGKTEAFLLPLIDHCLHLRNQHHREGIVAVVVYPMNALADDQLRRLRPLLAGTGITFGRYTGVTPDNREPEQGRLKSSRPYTDEELKLLAEGEEDRVAIPWEECFHRQEIQQRKPRILLTNYAQLEYLLLRGKDLDLFRRAPLRFLVFDEVHTYTGAVGSEVACLIRRLRHVARKSSSEVISIGTSATVQERLESVNTDETTREFAARLFGVHDDEIELVTEHYKEQAQPTGGMYLPALPRNPKTLLEKLLAAARGLMLQDEVREITDEILELTETLCGQSAPPGSSPMARAYALLSTNRVIHTLVDLFKSPTLLSEAFNRRSELGREGVSDDDLVAELLCYLILGALIQQEDEPLLRPKLHYFMQGYQGLGCTLDRDGRPRIHFDSEAATNEKGERVFPMALCRSCGQHYFRLLATQAVREGDIGVSMTRAVGRDVDDTPEGEHQVYLTTSLVGLDEGEDAVGSAPKEGHLCRFCGALHDGPSSTCLNDRCTREGSLVKVFRHDGAMKTCLACGTAAKGYEEIVTPAKSSEVADVTIMAQSMLTAMPEKPLQKLLVFSDNRQDAAFQAGWMEERSRRFRLRHLLYSTLESEPERIWSLTRLTEHIVDRAKRHGVLKPGAWDDEDNEKRVRWFLLEEFASTGQRRGSLESLALVEVLTKGIEVADAPIFFKKWSEDLDISQQELSNLVRLILDYYRRRGIVSDPLLRRKWSDRDVEVRKGLVSTFEQYRPQALVFAKDGKSSYTKALVARNGRSGAQEILKKGIPGGVASKVRDELLQDLWDWLNSPESEVVVPTTLTYKHGGKQVALNIPGSPRQINVDHLGFRLTDTRQLCPSCRRAQSVAPPSGACPEYGCKGTLQEAGRDPEHFDVHQYTRKRFVPLKTWEHSAQVPKEQRMRLEREFKKKTGGKFNCLVCTPTLELGVDIGKLEMVLMRNVPPTPANYAQRAGRAGRQHRIAVVFTHCRSGPHGRFFFEYPRSMIAGEIRVPSFTMRNEPLIRKHAHSAILTALRELADEDERRLLDEAFPPYISAYFADVFDDGKHQRTKFLSEPRDLAGLAQMVTTYRDKLAETLRAVFAETWPKKDIGAVSGEALARFVDDFHADLQLHVRRLFGKVKTYRHELSKLRRIEDDGNALTDEEETQRRRYRHALKALQKQNQENYALSYLSTDGFLPGYALAKEAVSAQCLEPYLEVSRPSAIALRELTPANFIYADKKVFRVRRLNFSVIRADDDKTTEAVLHREIAYDPVHQRIFEPGTATTEGGHTQGVTKIGSYQLTDVGMMRQQDIDDRERGRRKIPFKILGMALDQHGGGDEGHVGPYSFRFLRRQSIRLVNLGVPTPQGGFTYFPICTVCGATRSPMATEGEQKRFKKDHLKLHGRETTGDYALHVDFDSDTIHLGPFEERAPALNLFEALKIGARHVLDMGTNEVEGFSVTDEHGAYWAILYDPMPGGSGFLQQIIKHWVPICEKARNALAHCASGCETACYSCLKHFRNQIDHEALNRHRAIEVLDQWSQPLSLDHRIPQVVSQSGVDKTRPDSDAEINFATICAKRHFPVPPESNYRIEFGDGSYTDADWAYPDKKVLIYIDGMGEDLHGDPDRAMRDKLLRAKARMKGFQIVEITAEALQDPGSLAVHLELLAMYLDVDMAALEAAAAASPDQASDFETLIEKCDPELRPVLEAMRGRSEPLPELGYELPVSEGEGVAGEVEIGWPGLEVAVLGSWQEEQRGVFEAAGWTLFTLKDFQEHPDELWAALRGEGE